MPTPPTARPDPAEPAAALVEFLRERLGEELTALWERSGAVRADSCRPGTAAQLEVLDRLLCELDAGRLPEPLALRLLLFAFADHPRYDPGWGHQTGPGALATGGIR